ncbi:MAG: hypothetical protein QXR09_00020 [Candidatus Aenigmatarchaeota archaeon]
MVPKTLRILEYEIVGDPEDIKEILQVVNLKNPGVRRVYVEVDEINNTGSIGFAPLTYREKIAIENSLEEAQRLLDMAIYKAMGNSEIDIILHSYE